MLPSTPIPIPRVPESPPPFTFPVVGTVAPVLVAIGLFAVTRSPVTLVFAALGPVIALGALTDSRWSAARAHRRSEARFARELSAARDAVDAAHREELAVLRERYPSAAQLLAGDGQRGRWRLDGDPAIAVGTGEIPSRLAQAFGAEPSGALADLATGAAVLADAPVVVDPRDGIAVVGPSPLAAAVARGIVLRLAWLLPPGRWWCGQSGEPFAAALPHQPGPPPRSRGVQFGTADQPSIRVAVAADESEVPDGCGVVVAVGGGRAPRIQWHPDPALRGSIRVHPVSSPEARYWAQSLRAEAGRAGVLPAVDRLPDRVPLTDLLTEKVPEHGSPSLAAAFAVGGEGPVTLDLVRHGPHAVVGGTTGSGKSELLIAWVVALAHRYRPTEVSFLLVDFKGGSAFAPLEALPHVTGILSDLDAPGALRALSSLRAELRHRERIVADAGAKDIGAVPGMPRLVIMVDEFAAMLGEHPDLHALFADLSARGRSLGIHLVLCTQRPAGVVRDAVLANADLRISLRVNNRADSGSVIGSDAAAALGAEPRGRAYVAIAGADAVPVQFALAGDDDLEAVLGRHRGAVPARRPWLAPLPAVIPLGDLPAAPAGVPFGLLDLPEEQRRAVAVWDPAEQGGLLVLGGARSGCSTALSTIAAGLPVARWLPEGTEAAWDVLGESLAGPVPGVLLADDLDALVGRLPEDHRSEFVERLVRLAREGPADGRHLAVAMRRIPGELQVLSSLLPMKLLLRHASRSELVLAGGDGAAHDPGAPPGAGTWQGSRVQVALGAATRPPDPVPLAEPWPAGPVAVVTTRHAALAARLSASGLPVAGLETPAPAGGTAAIVADLDQWQSHWGALAALRPLMPVVVDGCSAAELRQLTRSRQVPPPLRPGQAWLITPDGAVRRTALPSPAGPS